MTAALPPLSPRLPVKVIGRDDWLIYGKLHDGTLVFAVVELSTCWRGAPHLGAAPHGSTAWQRDWRYMLNLADRAPGWFTWYIDDLAQADTERRVRKNTQRMIGWDGRRAES